MNIFLGNRHVQNSEFKENSGSLDFTHIRIDFNVQIIHRNIQYSTIIKVFSIKRKCSTSKKNSEHETLAV